MLMLLWIGLICGRKPKVLQLKKKYVSTICDTLRLGTLVEGTSKCRVALLNRFLEDGAGGRVRETPDGVTDWS